MTNKYYFFWGTCTTFIRALPKIFCSVNGALVLQNQICWKMSPVMPECIVKHNQNRTLTVLKYFQKV